MSQSDKPDSSASLRLLADGMLGRLAKWLRLLGYDTAYENDADDAELARRARAESRILLTRDHELAARRGLRTLLIQSEVLEEQVREVQDALGPPPHPALSRCSVCNVVLEAISPDEIADRVPPFVLQTQTKFRRCPGCGRVYWPGTHLQAMREQMERFTTEGLDNA
ncbi:MAG: Mut7-C RNAse domain-containing protein [Anaerolineae bacterium]